VNIENLAVQSQNNIDFPSKLPCWSKVANRANAKPIPIRKQRKDGMCWSIYRPQT